MQNEIIDEIENFKNTIIYLDWNVFSYLFQLSNTSNDYNNKAKCFSFILDNFLQIDKICFVFSEAHYRDILLGAEEYYDKKKEYLYSRTCGWKVKELFPNKEYISIDKLDKENFVKDFSLYKKKFEYADKETTLNQTFLNEFLGKTISDNSALDSLRMSIKNIIGDKDTISNLSILRINKSIRNSVFVKESKTIIYPNTEKSILDVNLNIQDVVLEKLNESNINYSIVEHYFEIIEEVFLKHMSSFSFEILKLSFLSDFIGLSNEKLSKPTSFEGLINDTIHLTNALRLPVFISEDKNLLTKARFIKKWMNLNVNIFDMNSFNVSVLKQIFGEGKNISFSDNNGIIIANYIL